MVLKNDNEIDDKNISNSSNKNNYNNDLVSIETNMNNYLIEYFCQSNQTKDILGLSSYPSDYIYNDKECTLNKKLSNNASCYVVQGLMSLSICSNCEQENNKGNTMTNYYSSTYPNATMDLQTMYLDAIKLGMNHQNNKLFISNNILNVTFINNDKNSLLFETEGSGYTNTIDIINNNYTNTI